MNTIYDLATTILFAGLAILFLQRSSESEDRCDKVIHYVPPAIGCAAANWLGNKHMDLAAILVTLCVIAYTLAVLKPFTRSPK